MSVVAGLKLETVQKKGKVYKPQSKWNEKSITIITAPAHWPIFIELASGFVAFFYWQLKLSRTEIEVSRDMLIFIWVSLPTRSYVIGDHLHRNLYGVNQWNRFRPQTKWNGKSTANLMRFTIPWLTYTCFWLEYSLSKEVANNFICILWERFWNSNHKGTRLGLVFDCNHCGWLTIVCLCNCKLFHFVFSYVKCNDWGELDVIEILLDCFTFK